MIKKVNGGFVISSQQVWRPGFYACERSAKYAFRFKDEGLQELMDRKMRNGSSDDQWITFDDLKELRRKLESKENEKPKTTQYGNNKIPDVTKKAFHKPRKAQYTAIIEFEVVKPGNDIETVGERLKLSMHGEYCPDASLRGYQLEFLLMKPENYRAKVIIQMGRPIVLNYEKK